MIGRQNSNAAVMFHSVVAERMGLGLTEEKTVDLLQRLGPLTAGEIVQHTGLAPASVSGLIDRLVAKGFVTREKDPADRRRVIVRLDHHRLTGFAPVFDELMNGLDALYATYTEEELAVILDYLRRATAIQVAATGAISGKG
ncbi:MarR family transcriptional regulator [Streptosporangium soli]|nr:MarR family transcriptional regulator [Streptosporangium sp. KLBMP 9127]